MASTKIQVQWKMNTIKKNHAQDLITLVTLDNATKRPYYIIVWGLNFDDLYQIR